MGEEVTLERVIFRYNPAVSGGYIIHIGDAEDITVTAPE